MLNVLIVAEHNSILVKSLEVQLIEKGFGVYHCPCDAENIKAMNNPVDAIILYLDGETASNEGAYMILRMRYLKSDAAIYTIGSKEDLIAVTRFFPIQRQKRQFERGISMKGIQNVIISDLTGETEQIQKKILVVDDSGEALRTIKAMLSDKYDVALASSGAMAIRYMTLHKPDLLLLDYEMPVLDGKQLLEMLKSEDEFSKIPVIFLTGRSDKESVYNVMNLKPAGYLLKTMAPKEITSYIDEFLGCR